DADPAQPNEAYFRHVDFVVNVAAEAGLFIGMLPTWGSAWKGRNDRPPIFDADNAFVYGRYVGRRYREKPVIWILGGDQNINNEREADVITAMAQGLRQGDGRTHLMTYHPRGPGLSSDFFHLPGSILAMASIARSTPVTTGGYRPSHHRQRVEATTGCWCWMMQIGSTRLQVNQPDSGHGCPPASEALRPLSAPLEVQGIVAKTVPTSVVGRQTFFRFQ
ncbi:MAG: DUF4038 domain-containing protein, partial [Anaerolineae bacterium]